MADFNITATTVGSVLAMYFYIYAAMQLPSGALADYLGPRKTLTFGCLLTGIGSITFGLSPSLIMLYIGRLLLSLGVSVIFISVLKIQTQWFPSRYFGTLSGLNAAISNTGTLLGATPMALLITLVGWRLSFEFIGLISLAICLACWLVVRNRPADLGLPSPAEIGSYEVPRTNHAPVQNTAITSFRSRISTVLLNRHTWPPFLIVGGSYGALLVLTGAWGIPYLMQVYNVTRDSAANFMLLAVIGHIIGTIITSIVSDKLRRRKLPAVISAFACLSLWLLLALWNEGQPPIQALYPLFFMLGFVTGYAILAIATVKEVMPSSVAGTAMGLVNMGVFLFAAVLQIAFGAILDLGWQGATLEGTRIYPLSAFQSGLLFVTVFVLAYVVGALLLKETYCRDIYD
jgi:sugar phosphate permease